MTVLGTRPEVIRLSRTIAKLDQFTDHCMVHTGQNYDFELNEIFFRDLGVRRPDHFLEAAAGTPIQTIANVIVKVDDLLNADRPDALLVLGDTNSCLAVLPAKRKQIPIFHMEAGNRCFDLRVPEEINRKIVDHSADVNLTYSDFARDNLIREGLSPDLTFKTGSPIYEVLTYHDENIRRSNILEKLSLVENEYFVVSAHREENVDSKIRLQMIAVMLNDIAEQYRLPIIFSTHPRTENRVHEHGVVFHHLVRMNKPFGFFDYSRLQMGARAVLSDSGTISEDSSILNFPALNIRDTHERQEAIEEGSVMMVGLSSERALQALEILSAQPRGDERLLRLVDDYAVPNVSDKVLRTIMSYTDYVNRVVWKKY